MSIRFQADADLNQIILSAVVRRVPAIDFRTAAAADLARLKELTSSISPLATDAFWSRTTKRPFARHFDEFVRSSDSGTDRVPQHIATHVAVDDLILIWTATQPGEWINRIMYLPI